MFTAHEQGATPDEALKQGTQLVDRLDKALRAKLGTSGDVAVSVPQFWITQVEQAYPRQMAEPTPVPEVRIYTAHTTVTVKTEKLDLLGALIEAGMKAGSTQLNSVSFTLSDAASSDNAAIAAASKEAAIKAGTVANSMGVKLGKILNISVNTQVQPQMIYAGALQGSDKRRAGSLLTACDSASLAAPSRRRGRGQRALRDRVARKAVRAVAGGAD
jgi:uncharacterized protein YggE